MRKRRSPFGPAVVLGLGLRILTGALLGLYLGSKLDASRNKAFFAPLFFFAGTFLGFYRAWIVVKSILNKDK